MSTIASPPAPPSATQTAAAVAVGPRIEARPTRSRRWKRLAFGGVIVATLVAGGVFAIPAAETALNTVSTDDAYVNGHVTLVAPRVPGQVQRVLVDVNVRVKAGDLLVELDPEPYQVQVNIKRAALAAAEADRAATESDVRGILAQLRAQRWKLQTAMEQVDNQVALLKARVAALRNAEVGRELANADLARARSVKSAISQQEMDSYVAIKKVADAKVAQALEDVRQVRVALGLPTQPTNGDLNTVPADLNQTFSAVRQALADLVRIKAQLGLPLGKAEATPKQVLDEFRSRDAEQDIDRIFAVLLPEAPAMKQAEAKLLRARRNLDQAELNLRYTRVVAEIDGVVARRNVNPGNNVQAGQQVMAVRSLTEIWIDANFKETQLADLRIGQRVEVVADTYGSHRVFRGRITGFTYGTGSTLALLPPPNATGNFVKVVQRLPIRIELEGYDPDADTLFAGLSVTPYVYVKEPPVGSNAGRRLQGLARPVTPAGGRP